MPNRVLIDNWTLQNAGELLQRGPSGEFTTEIDSSDQQSLKYLHVSQDIVAIECLCQLLNHLVLADEVLVDSNFIESWTEFKELSVLTEDRILRPMAFKLLETQWHVKREAMIDLLCFCSDVRARHAQNTESYAATQESVDPMLAQLLWGGAGMLARADYFRAPYEPHPLREQLFLLAGVFCPPQARSQLASFVEGETLSLYQRSDQAGIFGRFSLPPIVVQVLDNASSLSDLVPAALHVRQSYTDLRHWISELQSALDTEDIGQVLAQRKLLLGVARSLSQLTSLDPIGDTSIQFGVSWLDNFADKVGSALGVTQNRFRVRSQVKRLVLTPQGRGRFRKLLGLMGHEHTPLGVALEIAWSRRQGAGAWSRHA